MRGDIIVSLAGIATNLVLFVLFSGAFVVLRLAADSLPALQPSFVILQRMAAIGMWLNLVLAFFNLIPIPPLDGSHVFYHLLPPSAGQQYRQLFRFGFLPIMALSYFVPGVIGIFLWPAAKLMGLGVGIVGGFALPGVML